MSVEEELRDDVELSAVHILNISSNYRFIAPHSRQVINALKNMLGTGLVIVTNTTSENT